MGLSVSRTVDADGHVTIRRARMFSDLWPDFIRTAPFRPPGGRVCVYDLLGPDGEVIYVGQTSQPRQRFKAHYRLLLDDLAGVRIVNVWDDRLKAMAAESERIRLFDPPLNVVGHSHPSLAGVYDRSRG